MLPNLPLGNFVSSVNYDRPGIPQSWRMEIDKPFCGCFACEGGRGYRRTVAIVVAIHLVVADVLVVGHDGQ